MASREDIHGNDGTRYEVEGVESSNLGRCIINFINETDISNIMYEHRNWPSKLRLTLKIVRFPSLSLADIRHMPRIIGYLAHDDTATNSANLTASTE